MNIAVINSKGDMAETDLSIHALSNLPEDHEVAITDLERRLKNTGPIKLEIEAVCTSLNSRYKRLEKQHYSKKDKLVFVEFKQQYKCVCSACGQYGHK